MYVHPVTWESSVRQPVLRSHLVHLSGKYLDEMTVTVTGPVSSLEAYLILNDCPWKVELFYLR
jgi:hypothetical protein